MDIHNLLYDKFQIHNHKCELLIEEKEIKDYFKELFIYLTPFMKKLWNNPKSIANILLSSEKNEIEKHLAHFVTHNLYENLFSLNGKEEQLLYIIALLLKEEINNFQSKEANSFEFLIDSPCTYIFKELIYKKEVQGFFKNILKDILTKIEISSNQEDISFEPKEIFDFITKNIYNSENKNEIINVKKNIISQDNIFFSPLTLKEIEEKCLESKDKEMISFLKKKISINEKFPKIYSNELLLDKIFNFGKNIEILSYYSQFYTEIVDIINILLDNLLNYANSLPYYIKCICKIISILIEKKYPEANKVERNSFLSKFFFNNLLFISFKNPTLFCLINEHLITEKTLNRLIIVETILSKFISGDFFVETDNYITFNNYFIEKMPRLLDFFDIINKVNLPSFIDKFVNDKLPEDYDYDYLRENPEENIFYRNICFNIDNLNSLIINVVKSKDSHFLNDKSVEKLISKIQQLKINNSEGGSNENIKYFLLTDIIRSKKYEKIKNIKRDKKYFSIKEKKIIESNDEMIQNNIIKAKNFFCSSFYNYPILNKNEFLEVKTSNIINILKEISNYSNLNPYICSEQVDSNSFLNSLLKYIPILENREISKDIFIEDKLNIINKQLKDIKEHLNINKSLFSENNPIPIKWFLDSLIQYLQRLPDEYIENDYELLLQELENDINYSINLFDFELLSKILDNLNEIKKNKYHYNIVKNILIDIDLNIQANKIIENEQIPVNILFKDKKFRIEAISLPINFNSLFPLHFYSKKKKGKQ